jgi:hypothetical protein
MGEDLIVDAGLKMLCIMCYILARLRDTGTAPRRSRLQQSAYGPLVTVPRLREPSPHAPKHGFGCHHDHWSGPTFMRVL